MKIITVLPNYKIHFKPIQVDNHWQYVWQHKGSYLLRVCANVLDPWGQRCVVRIKENKYKSETERFTNRIDLTILPVKDSENAVPGKIIMESPFLGIPHSTQPTLRFYAIPCTENEKVQMNIMISVVEE